MSPISSSLNSQEMPIQEMGNNDSSVLDHHQTVQDDFLDQMISILPSWADLSPSTFCNTLQNNTTTDSQKLFCLINKTDSTTSAESIHFVSTFDESTVLASRLRQHQISSGGSSPTARSLGLLQLNTTNLGLNPSQILSSRTISRSPTASVGETAGHGVGGGEGLPIPLSLVQGGSNPDSSSDSRIRDEVVEASFITCVDGAASVQGLYNGFQMTRGAPNNSQQFQSYARQNAGINQSPTSVPNAAGGTVPARPRVRARRGQATDPHSIAERLRRERIAERMKALQELVPNANKTDKASMLDEIIDYVKFLQLQVKVLSMSRLGGAAAVSPLVANISPEGGGVARRTNGDQAVPPASSQDGLTATGLQVVRLMEEDMGSAMQYLQGKGLCLMPISLASAISSSSCHPRNGGITNNGGCAGILDLSPPSPSISVLTVQSALGNSSGCAADALKDATSVSKP